MIFKFAKKEKKTAQNERNERKEIAELCVSILSCLGLHVMIMSPSPYHCYLFPFVLVVCFCKMMNRRPVLSVDESNHEHGTPGDRTWHINVTSSLNKKHTRSTVHRTWKQMSIYSIDLLALHSSSYQIANEGQNGNQRKSTIFKINIWLLRFCSRFLDMELSK